VERFIVNRVRAGLPVEQSVASFRRARRKALIPCAGCLRCDRLSRAPQHRLVAYFLSTTSDAYTSVRSWISSAMVSFFFSPPAQLLKRHVENAYSALAFGVSPPGCADHIVPCPSSHRLCRSWNLRERMCSLYPCVVAIDHRTTLARTPKGKYRNTGIAR